MQHKSSLIKHVSDVRMGNDPDLEAWLYHFLVENNLEHLLSPSNIASPEQLRFMVALRGDQVYIPCSDKLFIDLYNHNTQRIEAEYAGVWDFIVTLVKSYNLSQEDTRRILGFCSYRFKMYQSAYTVLPSRLAKRLVGIVLTQCAIRDPFAQKKAKANQRCEEMLHSDFLQSMLLKTPDIDCSLSIPLVRYHINMLEIGRLMAISTCPGLHRDIVSVDTALCGFSGLDKVLEQLSRAFPSDTEETKKILLIPDRTGGLVFDIELAKALVRQGHQVILAFKSAFYFNAPIFSDLEDDPTLKKMLASHAYPIANEQISKNELLRLLREYRFLVISDGTSEALNMYRTSVAFARAWKEADLIIANGGKTKDILLGTSHEFTRDIFCYWNDANKGFCGEFKPRASWVAKFAEKDLLAKANLIITAMRKARASGKTAMFYSAIIGSIPGQTALAIELVTAYVNKLRKQLENTYIINPAEHFVDGMDGDDLMFMWEHVQRSGLLDVWRFQTAEDIEASFSLIGRKIPANWLGKDTTFSTGCTKEMRIALEVQKNQPELQIIGPPAERFFRRRDYGIGKYYDVILQL